MPKLAYVVSGAVIVSDDFTCQVTYHPKCPECGSVDMSVTASAAVPSGTRCNLIGSFCPKCGKQFSVAINRDA